MKALSGRGALIGAALIALPLTALAQDEAETTQADPNALRVCASSQDAPYSDKDGSGFENRIAAVLAEESGLTLDLVMIPKDAIYLVRDGMDEGLCDVLIGVDAGDKRVLTSEPYYKSGYAFVSREDRNFQGDTWQDTDQEGYNTFAYRYHGPAETIMKYTGRYEYNLIYAASLSNFEDRRNKYTQIPASLVVSEVAQAKADLGIIFAPEAARYVRDSQVPLKMTLITNGIERSDGVVIPLQYEQAVGVINTRPDLLETINKALVTGKDRIDAVLQEEGIPTMPLS